METQIQEKLNKLLKVESRIFEIYKELRELESEEDITPEEIKELYKTEKFCLELFEKFIGG